MASEKRFDLSLVIKAVDKATGPLREVNKRIADATAPVRKLGNSLSALAKEARIPQLISAFGGVGSAVGRVGREALALGAKLAGIGAAAAFGLFHVVKGAVDAGDELATMAQRVGLSVDAYAQLSFAAAQADVDQESFNGAMDQFNKRLGEAKAGTGPLLAFLKRTGPGFAAQVKGAKSTEEAFGLMVKAFEAIPDAGRRAALSAAVFGRSGLQMGQFLGQGSKAIEEQRRKFFALSGSQEEFAKGAGELDNRMREAETAFIGLRNAAAAELFPALTEVSKAVAGVLAGQRGNLAAWAKEAGASISAWIAGGGIQRVVAGLKDLAETIGKVVDMVGGMKGVLVIAAGIMAGPLIASIVSLGGALWTLATAAVGVAGPISLALAPFLAGVAPFLAFAAVGLVIYANWKPISTLFGAILDDLRGISAEQTELEGRVDQDITPSAGPTITKRRFVDAAGARPRGKDTTARVVVDFNNAPKGLRVTPDRANTAPLDLSVGPALSGAQ